MDILAEAAAIVARRTQQHVESQIVLASILSGERRISKEVVLAALELVDYSVIGDPRQESQHAA